MSVTTVDSEQLGHLIDNLSEFLSEMWGPLRVSEIALGKAQPPLLRLLNAYGAVNAPNTAVGIAAQIRQSLLLPAPSLP